MPGGEDLSGKAWVFTCIVHLEVRGQGSAVLQMNNARGIHRAGREKGGEEGEARV